jgi:hypothetical protein
MSGSLDDQEDHGDRGDYRALVNDLDSLATGIMGPLEGLAERIAEVEAISKSGFNVAHILASLDAAHSGVRQAVMVLARARANILAAEKEKGTDWAEPLVPSDSDEPSQGGATSAFEKVSETLNQFRQMVGDGGASEDQRVDLGNGTVFVLKYVSRAGLLYQTADGDIHLDEVAPSAAALAAKLSEDPSHFGNLLKWRSDSPNRVVGVKISTDQGWTDLFSKRGFRPSMIEWLIAEEVPLIIGGNTLTPGQLSALYQATLAASADPEFGI